MKKFFCLLILSLSLIPVSASAAHKGRTWGLKPVVLQLLPYEALLNLPDDKRAAYIEELRAFNAKQELKWYGRDVTADVNVLDFMKYITLIDQAEAQGQAPAARQSGISPTNLEGDNLIFDPGTCPTYPSAFDSYVKNGHDKCEIGGFLVCMVLTNNNHLRCNPTDKAFSAFANKVCGANQIPCALPLYANDKGKMLCVPSSPPGPVSPKCEKASDPAKLANEMKDHPEYLRYYLDYKGKVEKYCGDKGGNAHTFDQNDCQQLQTRLDSVKSIYQAVAKNGSLCHIQSHLNGKTDKPVFVALNVKTDDNNKMSYQIQNGGSDKTTGWSPVQCDAQGRVTGNFVQSQNYADAPWKTCLARKADNGKTEVMSFGQQVPPCDLQYEVYTAAAKAQNGGCQVKMDNKTLTLKDKQVTADDKTSLPLVAGEGTSSTLYSVSGANGGQTQFVSDSDDCWARYVEPLPKDVDFMNPTPVTPTAPKTSQQK